MKKLTIMYIQTRPHVDRRLVNFQYVDREGQPISAWFQTAPAQIERMRLDQSVTIYGARA